MDDNEQLGRDIDGSLESGHAPSGSNLRRFYGSTIALDIGKVLISVTDRNGEDHHVVVPIPESYEAAIAIAFDQLHEHIPARRHALLGHASLKYGMRSSSGQAVWAKLPGEFWREIVKDGDHLMLSVSESALSGSQDGGAGSGDAKAEFVELLEFPSQFTKSVVPIGRVMVLPRPTSVDAAKMQAREAFYQDRPRADVFIYFKVGGRWRLAPLSIRDEDWMKVTEGIGKFPEIGVYANRVV